MRNYLQVCSKNSNVVYHKHHILNRPNTIGKMYRDILTVTMNIFSLPTGASFVTYVFTTSNEKHHTMKDYSEISYLCHKNNALTGPCRFDNANIPVLLVQSYVAALRTDMIN